MADLPRLKSPEIDTRPQSRDKCRWSHWYPRAKYDGHERMNLTVSVIAELLIDLAFALIPRRRPDAHRLEQVKLIAHRGNCGQSSTPENTRAAFDEALTCGAWGIEFDVRWTADDVAIICHDAIIPLSGNRVLNVEQTRAADLGHLAPHIPTLASILSAYRGRTHFMIEVKLRAGGLLPVHIDSLQSHLQEFSPGADYHLLGLDRDILDAFDFIPKSARIAVGGWNSAQMSEITLTHGYGATAGHYLLFSDARVARHHTHGQKVGTGFIRSRQSLFREVNRGVDWIFTNHTAHLAKILRSEYSN
ncbi:MAG: glycerophosphodiester phosphodiesterase [Bdellovibrionaceae bacterium]|nr:glycerophosphodiester phosphodiesterase [Pseudobdellovibrionaceae bacterium]